MLWQAANMFDFSLGINDPTPANIQAEMIAAMPKLLFAVPQKLAEIKNGSKHLKRLDDKNALDSMLYQPYHEEHHESRLKEILTVFAKRELVTADVDDGYSKYT
jgi:hypothetical protein